MAKITVTENYTVTCSGCTLDIQEAVRINLYDANPRSDTVMINNSGSDIVVYTRSGDKIEDEDTYTIVAGAQVTFTKDADENEWYVKNTDAGNVTQLENISANQSLKLAVNDSLFTFREKLIDFQKNGGIIDLLFIGDSIMEGQQTTGTWSDQFYNGFVGKIREYFNNLFDDLGTGAIISGSVQTDIIWNYNGNWSLAGIAGFGVQEILYSSSGAGDYLELDFEGVGIDFHYIRSSTTIGKNYEFYIDGTLYESYIVEDGQSSRSYIFDIVGLTSGKHTLKVVNVDGGTNSMYVVAARPIKNGNGIRVNNVSYGGRKVGNAVAGENTLYCTIDSWNPTVTFIAFLANDYNNQTELTTYEANLRTLVQRAKNFGDVAMVTVGMWNGNSQTIPQSDYLDTFKTVASEEADLLIDVFGSYGDDITNAASMGFLQDTVHYNEDGHFDCMKVILSEVIK